MVAEVPLVLGVDIEGVAPVGVDGEVIVVALVENEVDIARERAFLLVVEELHAIEADAHLKVMAGAVGGERLDLGQRVEGCEV